MMTNAIGIWMMPLTDIPAYVESFDRGILKFAENMPRCGIPRLQVEPITDCVPDSLMFLGISFHCFKAHNHLLVKF